MNFKYCYFVFLTIGTCSVLCYLLYQKNSFLNNFEADLDKVPIIQKKSSGKVLVNNNRKSKIGSIVIIGNINREVASVVIKNLKIMNTYCKKIDLFIYSPGGNILSAIGIVDVIKSIKVKVNTYAIGSCFSASTYILAGGTGMRMASKYSMIYLHSISNSKNQHLLKTFYRILNKLVQTFWFEHAKLPRSVNVTLQQDYWISPEDAKKWGIVDEIF